MQVKYIFLGLVLILSTYCTAPKDKPDITARLTSTQNYFYEYGGFDAQGNEITVLLLTKTGYDSLVVKSHNAINDRIDSIQTGVIDFPNGDIDMKGYSILNASNVETKLFTAKPN